MVGLSSIAATACSDSTTEPGGAIVKLTIVQTPLSQPKTNMRRGITLQLIAVPINADSNFVNTPVTWTSSDNTKATVDANGLVTTVAGGNVTISAAAGGQTGTYDLNIQFPVGTVTVTPASPAIRQEGAVTLSAAIIGTDNTAATGRTVAWSSSNTAVATVNAATGVVAGLTNGTATITATSEGVSGSTVVTVNGSALVATVTVTPATPFRGVGETVQLSHTSRAASGTTVTGTTATWASSSPATATVSATGLVTFLAAGTATITATVDNGIGANVNGATVVTGAPVLVYGVATAVPTIAESGIATYAVIVPAGTTELTVVTSGGSGDADLYAFSPSQTPGTLNTAGNVYPNYPSSTFTQVSGNGGNGESITISNPAAGTWRFIPYAFTGGGAVSGMSITATKKP